METRGQTNDRRLQEIRIVFLEIQLTKLIRQTQTPVVRDVEEISDEADSLRSLITHG